MTVLEREGSTYRPGLGDEEAQGLGRLMINGGGQAPTIVRDPGLVRCYEALGPSEARTRAMILAGASRQ